MSELLNLSEVDIWTYQILIIDLAIAVLMIAGLRFIRGLVTNVDSTEELASKDNFAFGIAMAGGTVALALMLTGAVSGEPGATLVDELLSVISYGVLGLVLLWIGRLGQDKLVLTGIEIQAQIKEGNLSAALVDVANTVATGLVLRAVMIWVESDTWNGLIMVLAAFVITQVLLAAVTRYRLMVYSRRHEGANLQAAFEAGNVALSLRYLGHISGVALAVTAASGVAQYDAENLPIALATWLGVTILFTVLVSVLAIFARTVILTGVDVVDEVDNQKNVGVAAVEAAIYISIGLFFTALFA
jgi:uncharacterized membrane protein YjfL (UPF0719 family)|tara:strand:+ start:316 stop:1218 length:903 start_codon:yes stop_codon:yes gene_type:complete